jgi:hypothetical protein
LNPHRIDVLDTHFVVGGQWRRGDGVCHVVGFWSGNVPGECAYSGNEEDYQSGGSLAVGSNVSTKYGKLDTYPFDPGWGLPLPVAKQMRKQPGDSGRKKSHTSSQLGTK